MIPRKVVDEIRIVPEVSPRSGDETKESRNTELYYFREQD